MAMPARIGVETHGERPHIIFWQRDIAQWHAYRASVQREGYGWRLPQLDTEDLLDIFKHIRDISNDTIDLTMIRPEKGTHPGQLPPLTK